MKNIRGQSFVELIAALVVVSIALTALVGLVTKSIANSTFTRNKTLATNYAEETMEWLRGQRDLGWSTSFYARTGSNWCLVSLSWTSGGTHTGTCGATEVVTGTIFRRELTFTRVNASTVNATVSLKWTDSIGTHEAASTTTFTNWKGNP